MNKTKANIIVISLVALIAIFGYLNLSVKSELSAKKDEFLSFYQDSKKIYLLKRLKKGEKAILGSLKSIKNPIIKDRSTSKIYIFENLNLRDLNKLLKRIQGAYLPLKRIDIKRDMTNHATVTLEVAK